MTYYQKYYEIINNRKSNPLNEDVKGHFHHIKPKSIYPELEKDKENIVKLTYKEHLLAHVYLYLYYKYELKDEIKSFKMSHALCCMLNISYNGFGNKNLSEQEIIDLSFLYENLVKDNSEMIRDWSNTYWSNEENRKEQSKRMKDLFNTPEMKQKNSIAQLKSYRENPDRLQKQTKHLKTMWRNEELRKKQSISQRKRRLRPEDKERSIESHVYRMKTVLQYSKNGEFIKEWRSSADVQRELGICSSSIINCANKKPKNLTAGGFVWIFKNGEIEKRIDVRKPKNIV